MTRLQRFKTNKTAIQQDDSLYEAILMLKTVDDVRKFMIDITTPAELVALKERWRVANLLMDDRLSYREISAQTGVSVTTIGRVARFLFSGADGYQLAMERLKTSKEEQSK